MENIYIYALREVSRGSKFVVDFETNTLKIGKRAIIDNGKYEGGIGDYRKYNPHRDDILEEIEYLYGLYKSSVPSERSDRKRFKYFKALPLDKLTDEDMIKGVPREYAQLRLELFILCAKLDGTLTWTDEMGKWFWQSPNDKDLVLLKSWICKGA